MLRCAKKVAYKTKEEAEKKIELHNLLAPANGWKTLKGWYKCPYCGDIHTTVMQFAKGKKQAMYHKKNAREGKLSIEDDPQSILAARSKKDNLLRHCLWVLQLDGKYQHPSSVKWDMKWLHSRIDGMSFTYKDLLGIWNDLPEDQKITPAEVNERLKS